MDSAAKTSVRLFSAVLFGLDLGLVPWLAIASVMGVVAVAALLLLSQRKKGLEGA